MNRRLVSVWAGGAGLESGQSGTPPDSRGIRASRLSLAVVCLFFGLVAFGRERAESAARQEVDLFLSKYGLDLRRPEMAETARLEGTADLGKQVAVRAVVQDLAGSARLGELEPELRDLWIRSVEWLPDETRSGRALGLQSIAARPGWAYGYEALAELELAFERRSPRPAASAKPWMEPLRVASRLAPADEAIVRLRAAASLEHWPILSEADRNAALPAIKAALRDERFMRQALPAVVALLGRERGLALMPESAGALTAARQILGSSGEFDEKVDLQKRWERAERAERLRAIERVQEYLEAERPDRAAQAAREFLQRHPVDQFDDEEGRRQALVVLRAVADGVPGAWTSDPRGALVRYFLAGPYRGASGTDLLRATTGLIGIPEATRARLFLAAGETYGWKRLVEEGATLASDDWAPFWVDLARRRLAEGNRLEAQATARRISRFVDRGCDVLLLRREVGRVREDRDGLADVEEAWNGAFPETVPLGSWAVSSGRAELPVCVDPERDARRALVVSLRTDGPAYVWWGWDGGRWASVRLDGPETVVAFPLAGLAGRRTFALGTSAGATVTPLEIRVSAPPAGATVAAP